MDRNIAAGVNGPSEYVREGGISVRGKEGKGRYERCSRIKHIKYHCGIRSSAGYSNLLLKRLQSGNDMKMKME